VNWLVKLRHINRIAGVRFLDTVVVGHFTFWISLSLRLSMSPKLGLRPKIKDQRTKIV